MTGFYLCILNTRRSFHLRLTTNSTWWFWHKYISPLFLLNLTVYFLQIFAFPLWLWRSITTVTLRAVWSMQLKTKLIQLTGDKLIYSTNCTCQSATYLPTYVTTCLDVLIYCLDLNFIQFQLVPFWKLTVQWGPGWCTLIKFHASMRSKFKFK